MADGEEPPLAAGGEGVEAQEGVVEGEPDAAAPAGEAPAADGGAAEGEEAEEAPAAEGAANPEAEGGEAPADEDAASPAGAEASDVPAPAAEGEAAVAPEESLPAESGDAPAAEAPPAEEQAAASEAPPAEEPAQAAEESVPDAQAEAAANGEAPVEDAPAEATQPEDAPAEAAGTEDAAVVDVSQETGATGEDPLDVSEDQPDGEAPGGEEGAGAGDEEGEGEYGDEEAGVLEDEAEGDDGFEMGEDQEGGEYAEEAEEGGYVDEPEEEEEEEEEEQEEEEEDLALEPDNPLYTRIRAALKTQLDEQQLRLSEESREKEEEFRRIKHKKEDVGVELYGVQQQLARMQLTLEKTHDNFNTVRKLREQAESESRTVNKEYGKKQAELSEQNKRMAKFQTELDKLNSTLQQVEKYNEQMKGEIAITRRATYKAEEQVGLLEQDKKHQDLLIEDLMRSTKQLQDKLNTYSSQLAAQKAETAGAEEVLRDANREMEKIRFEKKQLLAQWKSSLLAVQRRDEHLQSLQSAVRELQQEELAIAGEVTSLKRQIRKEQDDNEAVVSMLNKVRNSAIFLERQIDEARQTRARLNEQYVVLQRSLEQSDADVAKVDAEIKGVTDATGKIDKLIATTYSETQKIEQQVIVSLAEQTTLQKSAQSVDKQTQAMQNVMHGRENEVAQVRNELARIKVDSLNTIAHNEQLKMTVKDIEEELKRKEALVVKYETEIRRRNDDIEKKMRDLDTLNRRYETLRAKFEEQVGADAAVTGPLEATIKSCRMEIDVKRKICNDLQRMWMGTQTELVKLSNEASAQGERVSELKAQAAVLGQKRARVEGSVGAQQKELAELHKSIATMHSDMARLNEMIGKSQESRKEAEGANFSLETDFTNTLKDLEEVAIRLENQVKAAYREKERVKDELVEKEREIMVLERKIELEKETQAAYLKKDEGGDVINGMKREIHRMQLRYSQLMRRQEELMAEMERAIFKRDSIAIRGKAKQQMRGGDTKADLRKMLADMGKRAKDLELETQRHERSVRQLDEEGRQVGQRMEEAGVAVREVQREEEDLQEQMFRIDRDKRRLKEEAYALQRLAKRYEALARGQADPPADPAEVEAGLQAAGERGAALQRVAARLAGADERLAAALEGQLTPLELP